MRVDSSESLTVQPSPPRGGKILYWLFIIIPVIFHVVVNLSLWCHLTNLNQSIDFWCDLSNHSVNNHFLYYIKFIWFAPLYWVLLNIGGLLHGPPQDFSKTSTYEGWNTSNALLLVSYVSKGENQETLYRATRETQRVLEEYNVNYMIEVVSDTKIDKKKRIRKTQRPVYYYDVPSGYQTMTKVKFKARGLQYLLEQRTNRLSAQKGQDINDVWVLHLDEESILTQQAVKGIEKFINKHNIQNSDGAIGQGEILYNSYNYGKKNWLVTAADALRTGDDLGRFRFQYNILHKPISGVHGSFLLVPAVIEQEIGWDLGSSSQITEDISFALRAMEKKIHFDWIDGFIKEQSAFGFKDFMNQRDRWYRGLTAVTADKNLRLTTRMMLGATVISWSICWIGIFVNYYNIFINFYIRESYFPDWAIVSSSILAGLVGSVYAIGSYRNVSYWFAPIWKKIIMLMLTYLLFITTLLPLMEAFAVLYSMIRLVYFKVTKTSQDFYVVVKD